MIRMSQHCLLFVFLLPITVYSMKESQSAFADFGIGAASSAVAMGVYTPFHYFQNRRIQNLPIVWNSPRYWFRGLPSLAFGKVPTVGIQMATYNAAMNTQLPECMQPHKIFLSTLAAACTGSIINNTTHLLALHQENKGTSLIKTVSPLCPHAIVTRALGTTMAREAIFVNIYMDQSHKIQEVAKQYIPSDKAARMVGNCMGGIFVALGTQPFMVASARLYADMEKKLYKNGFDVLYKIITQEGPTALYKGSAFRSCGVVLALPTLKYTEDILRNYLKKESIA